MSQFDYSPKLSIKEVQDIILRRNFQLLDDWFQGQNQLLGFKFFEAIFTQQETARKVTHGLGYAPLDIVLTHLSGGGSATFLYSQFTSTDLFISSTGACRVRFFAGSYFNNQSSVGLAVNASQKFSSV